MKDVDLVKTAIAAMDNSYSPYSNCKVGAALLCENGKVFSGCNIENAAYGPTICAERTAIFKAISEGERSFSKIAIAGGYNGNITSAFVPCGVCRQVLSEFCAGDLKILCADSCESFLSFTLEELLPHGFSSEKLKD